MKIVTNAVRGRPGRVVRVDEKRVERELEALRRAGYAVDDPEYRQCRDHLERAARRGPLCFELGLVRLLAAGLLASAPPPASLPAPWTASRLALFLGALNALDERCVRCVHCPYDARGC